jgi:hypothetical protein
MRKLLLAIPAMALGLTACANTAQSVADVNAAYNVAVAAEQVYAASPQATPDGVHRGQALLAAAMAAMVAWQNAPAGSTKEQATLAAAIAALVAFESNSPVAAPAKSSFMAPDLRSLDLRRAQAVPAYCVLNPSLPGCPADGVHRGLVSYIGAAPPPNFCAIDPTQPNCTCLPGETDSACTNGVHRG